MPGELNVVIVGAGATGLTGRLYCANQGLQTVILESMMAGTQIINAEKIENFPGAADEVSGADLAARLLEQAMAAGAEMVTAEVTSIARDDPYRMISTSEGDYRAKAIILAMGSTLRKLGIPGEDEFVNKGI